MSGTADLSVGSPPEWTPPEPGAFPDDDPAGTTAVAGEEWAPEVPEPVVRGLLATLGTILGGVPGLAEPDVPDHWHFTPSELDGLTPPVTRIVNARPRLRAAAARGDELTIAIQLAGYTGRNVMAGAEARRNREPEELFPDDHFNRQGPLDGPVPDGTGDDAPQGPWGWPGGGDGIGSAVTPPPDD